MCQRDEAAELGLVVHTPEEARMSMKQRMDAIRAKFGVGETFGIDGKLGLMMMKCGLRKLD